MFPIIGVFFAGLFGFNAIPHLIKGITGQTHMTPFKRVSSAYLNVLWAFVNLATASFLVGFDPTVNLSGLNLGVFLLGGFAASMADAQLFSNPNARLPWQKD